MILTRRRLRNPKVLCMGILIVFFIVFLTRYLPDEYDTSELTRNRLKSLNKDNENQLEPPNLKFDPNKRGKTFNSLRNAMSSMQRLVHLDLKGSQPKLNYLIELIPFMHQAGATGVLIEYEDFFPYQNDLESIKNQNHYTSQELGQIFKLLKDYNLKIVPLVQTYGHLEYVLKLKQFAYLREDKRHFQSITPCLNDTYEKVLFRMVDQIIDAHPDDLTHVHIGGDEVYIVGKNPACHEEAKMDPQDRYIK